MTYDLHVRLVSAMSGMKIVTSWKRMKGRTEFFSADRRLTLFSRKFSLRMPGASYKHSVKGEFSLPNDS